MGQVDHVLRALRRDSHAVIEIWLDERLPPSGRVVSPGEEPQPFDGWLQLLHILGDVITQQAHAEPASG
jgi:hypothetical protein